ncbi:hypothetical protein MLD38_027623 [Melastoma candidum]|uniref:Uncharacterized protein n=1 Tax=Melastoma candidum TaxID=119954 RepID=A0ACB9P3A6_9MYRT|nr:hypothetical protein MLD38_027623 [Melastoma candidum]
MSEEPSETLWPSVGFRRCGKGGGGIGDDCGLVLAMAVIHTCWQCWSSEIGLSALGFHSSDFEMFYDAKVWEEKYLKLRQHPMVPMGMPRTSDYGHLRAVRESGWEFESFRSSNGRFNERPYEFRNAHCFT